MKNSRTFVIIFLLLFAPAVAACTAGGRRQDDPGMLNVKDFGASGDGRSNDLKAIQTCIETAVKEGGVQCFFPAGTYLIDGNLYLPSGIRLKGEGSASVLQFVGGSILSEKNGSRDFYYTGNYSTEIIPDKVQASVARPVREGDLKIFLKENEFKPGDYVFTFNGRKNSWAILEDHGKASLWNSEKAPMAHSEIARVVRTEAGYIILDRPIRFALPPGSSVTKHTGSRNIIIEELTIINQQAAYAIIMEEAFECRISNVKIEAKGGIALSNHAYKCEISDCYISARDGRAILVENFSTGNRILNNVIVYETGGDAAIMLVMGAYQNEVSGNQVTGTGISGQNEGGIMVHALCYENTVEHNTITGTAEGIGCYYGAFDNRVTRNRISKVRVGLVAFHARNNVFEDNKVNISSERKGNLIGALIYGSRHSRLNNNTFEGKMVYGIQLEGAQKAEIGNNKLTGPSPEKYSFGIKIIGSNNYQTGHHQIQNNLIKNFKYRRHSE